MVGNLARFMTKSFGTDKVTAAADGAVLRERDGGDLDMAVRRTGYSWLWFTQRVATGVCMCKPALCSVRFVSPVSRFCAWCRTIIARR